MTSLATLALLWALRSNPACGLAHGGVDLHVDLPFQAHYRGQPGVTTTAALRRGCVRTVVLSLFVPHQMQERDLRALLGVLGTAEALVRARGWAAVGQVEPGQVGVLYAVEGAEPLAEHVDRVPALVARGVRLFGLVHTHHNSLASSSSDPHPRAEGLTPRGRRLVRAVYDAGALVDVSHASDATFEDVAAIARAGGKPLVASHSNARALAEHPRNLSDDQLRAVADSGGIVGVAFHAPFLREAWQDADVQSVVEHIVHMHEVMGEGHVGIGSDLDGLITPGDGLDSHAALPRIVAGLEGRGLSRAAIVGILGADAARVLGLQ